jgi:hypothetical protein
MSDFIPGGAFNRLPMAHMPRYHIVDPHPRLGYSQWVKQFRERRHGVISGWRLMAKRELFEGMIFILPWWFTLVDHSTQVPWNDFNPFWKAEESRPDHLNAHGRHTAYNMSLGSLDWFFFYVVITQDVHVGEELCLNYGAIDGRTWDSRIPQRGEGRCNIPEARGFPRELSDHMMRMQLLVNNRCPAPDGAFPRSMPCPVMGSTFLVYHRQ